MCNFVRNKFTSFKHNTYIDQIKNKKGPKLRVQSSHRKTVQCALIGFDSSEIPLFACELDTLQRTCKYSTVEDLER